MREDTLLASPRVPKTTLAGYRWPRQQSRGIAVPVEPRSTRGGVPEGQGVVRMVELAEVAVFEEGEPPGFIIV